MPHGRDKWRSRYLLRKEYKKTCSSEYTKYGQDRYNTGVQDADNRANANSANYKAGYSAGQTSMAHREFGTATTCGHNSDYYYFKGFEQGWYKSWGSNWAPEIRINDSVAKTLQIYTDGYNSGSSSGRSGTKIRLHLKGWENMKSSKGEWSQNGGPQKSDYHTFDKNYGDSGEVRALGAGYGAADCWVEWLN